MKHNRNLWVYDIETLASCFTYVAYNVDTAEIVEFVLHKQKNDITGLIAHLKEVKGHVGFNNLAFDYPVIHYILSNIEWFTQAPAENIIKDIYKKAQSLINENSFDNIIKQPFIHQLDLFKLWHYNNKARSTSLKSLQISMNYENVLDMPIHHSTENIHIDQVRDILYYNTNDVLSTYEFYMKSLSKIELRKSLINQFNIPCINWSDSKIGEQLVLKLYCDKTQSNIYDIKELRTYRKSINLNHCILPYIQFKSREFSKLLDNLKSKVITETKGAIKESVIYKGFKYDYGTGGIHGCIKSGIYESTDDYIVLDADVSSLYPSLAITNNLYPKHLGKDFTEVYKSIIDMRMEAKKAKNMVLSDGFKLAANSCYGKSNDVNSFLYDPKFTMQITLNGQLLLSMLAETLVDTFGTKLTVLQINTDGITVKIPREFVNQYYALCKLWEAETKLQLEYVEYSKMIIGDVNNYIAVTTTGKIKHKGRFEVDKVVGSEPAYHKDNSFRIVPLALEKYFVQGIPVEETILNHTNIYDFCGRQKFRKNESTGETRELAIIDGEHRIAYREQQHNCRYYISNKGATFVKKYTKGSEELINKGFLVTIFNKYEQKDDYDINYNFYISECKKEINNICSNQLTLF
jgi:hypothetical protein